jgi:GntR family transcriptional regulator
MYASIRDQLASEITAGVYPPGALLPSIREIMQRWDVSTTTARRVLDELAASGFARKEGTRGHISTGGAQPQQAPPAADHDRSRKAPPPAAVPGRLTIRPAHTIPAGGSISPDAAGTPALDVRAERPPADAALALRAADPSRPVIVRRRLLSAADGTPVELRVSYLPAELAGATPIAETRPIPEAWPAALASYLGRQIRLASSHVTARHPNQEEAAALALASDAAVLVREDIHEDHHGNPVDYTRTVWPGDSTRLEISG